MSKLEVWKSNSDVAISNQQDISSALNVAVQLRDNDKNQIISAYNSGNYQMLSTYVWTKTISALKAQLAKMGSAFVGEMLDRADITESTNLQNAITDFDALQLAQDLGLITNKSSFRLKQSMDLVNYFNNAENEEGEDIDTFSKHDAETVLLSCIQSILGHEKVDLSLNFLEFRDSLENQTLTEEDKNLKKLVTAPYFFKRATLRILLSIIKIRQSAQLENSLANANIIIPKIWTELKQPERWQIGKAYAELNSEGKLTAVSGLKKLLLKVKGFDYVPEDLRSNAFIKAANEIISAHEGSDNYYSEPSAVKILMNMGSVIPTPALPVAISATLCVKLGNQWGNAWNAQDAANQVLNNITFDRWVYYFEECFINDRRVLYKLRQNLPAARWVEFIKQLKYTPKLIETIKDHNVVSILKTSLAGKTMVLYKFVTSFLEE
ncbi:hypothetical protein [Pedobacter suwonensis]|uniref:hypothetical protein n=1 Tax=Pedobacter suwonensis TaxID=332999 RepID=UPI0036A15C66